MDGRTARLRLGGAFAYLKKLDALRREKHASAVKAARDEGRFLGFAEALRELGCEFVATPKQAGVNLPQWALEDSAEVSERRTADALTAQVRARELAIAEGGGERAAGELKGFEDALRVTGWSTHRDARGKAVNVFKS